MSTEKLIQEMGILVKDVRGKISDNRAETKQEVARMNAKLDSLEEKAQKITRALLAEKNRTKDLETRLLDTEKKLSRAKTGRFIASSKDCAEVKALESFIRSGKVSAEEDDILKKSYQTAGMEQKYLRTDSNVQGGFLAPPQYAQEVLKRITEVSPVREVAKVVSISAGAYRIPMRNVLMSAYWEGEGQQAQESTSQYALNEIVPRALTVYSDITIEMLEDAAFDMEAEITKDAAERFAQTEGQAFILGTGTNQPEGIIAAANRPNGIGAPQVIASGIANNFTADNLLYLPGQLKVGYNPAFMMNRMTIAYIRTLKDAVGRYLWEPGLAGGYPATVDGFPYVNAIDMPTIGANAIPVAFGDFYRGYTIVDRTIMWVVRDPFTLASERKVKFTFVRRVGGQVVMDEAIKLLQCAV